MKRLSKKGEMGMGTLIIFIAMVLVAAVAAAVLISTTGNLQNKALATGKAATAEVGTSLNVLQVYAEDGSDQSLEEFNAVIKLNAGSDDIRFSDVLVQVNLNNASADYDYDANINCNEASNTTAGGSYGVNYSIQGNNYQSGYLTKGDVVKLCFESPRSVGESEKVRLNIIPKVGIQTVTESNLPDLILDNRVEVFP